MIFNVVMEKYVGDDDPRFRKIDELLGIMSERIRNNYGTIRTKFSNKDFSGPKITEYELNHCKEMKAIEELYTEIFGLKKFDLRWDVSAVSNAQTGMKSLTLFDKHTREKGLHKNAKMMIGVKINVGLVTVAELEPREINAIILHEIGHNFYNSVFQLLARLPINLVTILDFPTMAKVIPQTLLTLLMTDVLKITHIYGKVADMFSKFMNRFPKADKFINGTFVMFEEIKGMFDAVRKSTMLLTGFVLTPAILAKVALLNVFSFRYLFLYNVEKHADSFAVDYGYGKELASALDKIRLDSGSITGALREITPFEIAHDIGEIQEEIFSAVYSGYPSNQNRIKTGLDRLKRQQNDPSMSPEMRKALADDIKLYEDFYKNHYLSIDRAKEGKILTWTYRIFIDKFFNGKMDFREVIHAMDRKKYE